MTEQDRPSQGTSDAPDAEEPKPLTDWEKLEALEAEGQKKAPKPSGMDDPRIGGDGPQTPG